MIAIIDYEMGNLRSVQKAIERVGGDGRLIRTPAELARAEKIVLPGVAAFGEAMTRLGRQGLTEPLAEAIKAGVPYLGFCLGLQLLFEVSPEQGEHRGLGLMGGKVVRFQFDSSSPSQRLSVPHMGWNSIQWTRPCPMLKGLESGVYVYFAHSYHVVPAEEELTQTTTEYGYEFTSSVWRDNIFATQFHPEKSQAIGLKLLENFVKL